MVEEKLLLKRKLQVQLLHQFKMKTVFLLFDSLNRLALSPWGGNILTPNFKRFSQKSITFDTHYVGSLPCMPARRDLHTGRLNFLHRSWGPLEPFDHSFPEILKDNGCYTHLITDHYHYWEDGGATYHNRYSSWDFVRGQEWDKWKALVNPPIKKFNNIYHPLQSDVNNPKKLQGMVNREFIKEEHDYSIAKCVKRGLEFLDLNSNSENWFLQLECFDPHEPFFAPQRFRDLYPTGYDGPVLNWPKYQKVEETAKEVEEIRANYAALVSMCDDYFGKILDYFDENNLWKDTALIVSTDHGFMLAEHGWWAKSRMPFYEEISHIPLMIFHPDFNTKSGTRRKSLTQTIDLMPTILDFNNVKVPENVEGKSLFPVMENDKIIRDGALFGRFGAATNITDGRYSYFRYPKNLKNENLWEYTLMPTHQTSMFDKEEFDDATLYNSFAFLRGFPVLKLPAGRSKVKGQGAKIEDVNTVLFDLHNDPKQNNPIIDNDIETQLIELMKKMMLQNEAPKEAFSRLDFL